MKVKSLLFGLTVGLLLMIIFPTIFIYLNNYFSFSIIDATSLKTIGFILAGLGVLIFSVNLLTLKHVGRGTPVPIEPPKRLVIVGLYRYVRNSMYLGYFGIILGEFFIFGHWLLLVYFFTFVLLTHLYVVSIEEPGLKKRFGNNYDQYLRSVPRWIPKINWS